MNVEVKKEWVAALRSGDYPQGRNRLHSKDGFCCLGVLQDLYLKAHNLWWEVDIDNGGGYVTPSHSFAYLDSGCREWAGISGCNPVVVVKNSQGSPKILKYLSELNDTKKLSFEEIAKLIEEDESL